MHTIGRFYNWAQLPGEGHGYVRFKNGLVVCANLKPELNPNAPKTILVGEGPLREKWARILCDQNRQIPFRVYLKRGTNRWEYAGDFVVESWSESVDEIRRHEAKSKRQDVVRVIYLKEI
jgi:hypothetical protein